MVYAICGHVASPFVRSLHDDMSVIQWQTVKMVDKIHNKRPLRWFLREWRQHRGLTLEQVADRLETTRGVISELERGTRRMNDGWIAGFAWVYCCEPEDLFHDPKRPTPNELLASVASMMADARPEDTARIIDFIQFTLRKPA